ncbi:unnamed protein product [Didymodactylos carnosus]|uniref:SOCS box domain-containing protein n=1 Tax=Didymodactylos carnosus TaxID=1234261 RepID=A0A8S2HTW9_9BILA|nr:unnamed protein product [Didymodactylos carnosus]CAF3683968.1 unnamed protein product [Didymodactylos carnosus]
MPCPDTREQFACDIYSSISDELTIDICTQLKQIFTHKSGSTDLTINADVDTNLVIDGDSTKEKVIDLFEKHFPYSSINQQLFLISSFCKSKQLNISRIILNKIASILEDKQEAEENIGQNSYCLRRLRSSVCHLKEYQLTKFNNTLQSPLHDSVVHDCNHIFKLLLKAGFDTNVQLTTDRKTPLQFAVVFMTNDVSRRFYYVQALLAYNANLLVQDINNVTPFKRLCGLESNYPILYKYVRDYLLINYPDQCRYEFDCGLKNALYYWNISIIRNLLQYGSVIKPFQNCDAFIQLIKNISSTMFIERRSLIYVDTFLLCIIELLYYNVPCENYQLLIEHIFEFIYLRAVCCELNTNSTTCPSLTIVKHFLRLSVYYGYLDPNANCIRKQLSTMITAPVPRSPYTSIKSIQIHRQSIYDTLIQYLDYLRNMYKKPLKLDLLCSRQIRMYMFNFNDQSIESLPLAQHLKNKIFIQDGR